MANERRQTITTPSPASQSGWEREAAGGSEPERCSDCMIADPAYCVPGDSVRRVAQIMRSEQVSMVPIVDHPHHRRLVGCVIDRDLALAVVAEGRDPIRTAAASVMRGDLVTCQPGDTLLEVLCLMRQHDLRQLLVADQTGRLVGVISHDGIVAQLDRRLLLRDSRE